MEVQVRQLVNIDEWLKERQPELLTWQGRSKQSSWCR